MTIERHKRSATLRGHLLLKNAFAQTLKPKGVLINKEKDHAVFTVKKGKLTYLFNGNDSKLGIPLDGFQTYNEQKGFIRPLLDLDFAIQSKDPGQGVCMLVASLLSELYYKKHDQNLTNFITDLITNKYITETLVKASK